MYYVDGHCDTLSIVLDEGKSLLNNDLQFSIDEANILGGGIQTLAAFVDTKDLKSKNSGFERCNNIINTFERFQREINYDVLIKNKSDVLKAIECNYTKVLLSIENGAAISGNLDNIQYFFNKGVRMMSITWNDDNELGCGSKTNNDVGLTELGAEFVKKINDIDIVVDVSHSSEKTFWNTIDIANKPVVASHSNVYELCNNPRNLKDEQIKAIAKSGGIIGICFYSDFLNSKRKANVHDIVEHIKYIKNLVGIDYIGLGSDFDGMSMEKTAEGVENISKINNIMKELKKQCFSCDEIVKIMCNNWINLLKRILN